MLDEFSATIVIPVSSDEQMLVHLLQDLKAKPGHWRTVVVSQKDPSNSPELSKLCKQFSAQLLTASAGRGVQMNFGARDIKSGHIWFLHADSRLSNSAIQAVARAVERKPEALLYLDLKFSADGPSLMPLTSVGAFIRSRILRLPFGDQGFCLSAENFSRLEGFDESEDPGEDLRFVLRAHLQNIPVIPVQATITTSPRKYQEQGWTATTFRHLACTVREVCRYRFTQTPLKARK